MVRRHHHHLDWCRQLDHFDLVKYYLNFLGLLDLILRDWDCDSHHHHHHHAK
jgi:hypothetical protein